MDSDSVEHSHFGEHVLIDLYGCDNLILAQPYELEYHMKRAALEAGATIISSNFHHFIPNGVSGVVLIAESHLTIHTWPECGYASADIYTCGANLNYKSAIQVLKVALKCEEIQMLTVNRGRRNLNVVE